MKYIYLKIWGYKAIMNGLQSTEYTLDLSNNKFPVILLHGPNGIGKTTILNALSPEVDPPSLYIPGINAGKELSILNKGILYLVHIESRVNSKGDRYPTKVSFSRNGEELNPNGNVSSYYDTLQSEFNLDTNYLILTMLSITNRGLADKTPSERKKILSYMIKSLEIYNGMNKVFSKKSSIYKANINSLGSKISMIGNEATISQNLSGINMQIDSLNKQKEDYNKELIKAESYIKIIDPNGELQNEYQTIYNNIVDLNNKISSIDAKLAPKYNKLNIEFKDLLSTIEVVNRDINHYKQSNDLIQQEIDLLLAQHSEDAKVIMIKQSKIESMNMDSKYTELMETIDKYGKSIAEQEEIMNSLGVPDFNLTKSELIEIANILSDFRNYIFNIRDNAISSESLSNAVDFIKGGKDINIELQKLSHSIETINNDIKMLSIKQNAYIDAVNLLKKRPENCNIDTCEFIKHALENTKNYENIDINKLKTELDTKTSDYNYLLNISNIIVDIQRLYNNINYNKRLLSKVSVSSILLNSNLLLDKIANGYPFNEFQDIDNYFIYADIIDGYRNTKETLIRLYGDAKVYNERVAVINELEKELNDLNTKVNNTLDIINKHKNTLNFNKGIIITNENKLELLLEVQSLENIKMEFVAAKNKAYDEYIKIKDNIGKIHKHLDDMNNITNTINTINNTLAPLNDEREKLKYSLTLLSSYITDINEATINYNFMEKLKRYSSTTTGIQTVFMEMYMTDTLSKANEYLSLIFNGEISMLPYIINENEFRIPCIKNGMTIDDISSCSCSQICMISMILSIVLLMKASTDYNIIRLDEIDDGLDETNRRNFVTVLYGLINMLGLEQIFIVSHNTEFDTGMVDVYNL